MSDVRPHQPGTYATAATPGSQPPAAAAPAAPAGQLPPFSRVLPLIIAAVLLLAVFLVLVQVLLSPSDYTQRVIAFAIAAAMTMWLVYVLDGAQRRTIERLRLRMELEKQRDIAEALARERDKRLEQFMSTFVIRVHGSAGEFVPYPSPMAINLASSPYGDTGPRALGASDPRYEGAAGSPSR